MTQLSQIGSDEIHSLVNTFLISFPNLKCTSKVCAYGTCMKGRGNSLNLETCYCKRNYYGDSCQNRVDNIELDPDMMKQQQQNNSPPDWNKLYHTIFLLSSFTLVCLVVAMFIVGYFVGKNSKSTTVIASNPHMFNNSNNGNHIKTNHTSNTHNNLATHSSNNLNATGGPTSRLITQKTLPPMNSFPSVSALSVFSRVNSRLNSPDREHPNKSDHLLKENNTINDYEKAVRDSSTTAILVSNCDSPVEQSNTAHNEKLKPNNIPSREIFKTNTLSISTSGYATRGSPTPLMSPCGKKRNSWKSEKAKSLMLDVP